MMTNYTIDNILIHAERVESKNPEVKELRDELKHVEKKIKGYRRLYLTTTANRQRPLINKVKMFIRRKKEIENSLDVIGE